MVDAEYKLEGAWLCGFGAIACERRAFARPGEETEAPGAGPGLPDRVGSCRASGTACQIQVGRLWYFNLHCGKP